MSEITDKVQKDLDRITNLFTIDTNDVKPVRRQGKYVDLIVHITGQGADRICEIDVFLNVDISEAPIVIQLEGTPSGETRRREIYLSMVEGVRYYGKSVIRDLLPSHYKVTAEVRTNRAIRMRREN